MEDVRMCYQCGQPETTNIDSCERCFLMNQEELMAAALRLARRLISTGRAAEALIIIGEALHWDVSYEGPESAEEHEILTQLGYYNKDTHFYSLNLSHTELNKLQMAKLAFPDKSEEEILLEALDKLVCTDIAQSN